VAVRRLQLVEAGAYTESPWRRWPCPPAWPWCVSTWPPPFASGRRPSRASFLC